MRCHPLLHINRFQQQTTLDPLPQDQMAKIPPSMHAMLHNPHRQRDRIAVVVRLSLQAQDHPEITLTHLQQMADVTCTLHKYTSPMHILIAAPMAQLRHILALEQIASMQLQGAPIRSRGV